jgi:hypothetical protein
MTKEKLKEMQTESIASYRKKIAWAKAQNPKFFPHAHNMKAAIGIDWHGGSCPYCVEYSGECDSCPLQGNYGCCNGLWWGMHSSDTWSDWIILAEKVLEYIIEHGTEEKNV